MNIKTEVLSASELSLIHQKTLELMQEYGVKMQHKVSDKIFQENGAKLENGFVKFPPQLIMKALSTVPETFRVDARNPEHAVEIGADNQTVFGPAVGTVYVCDHINGRRFATFQDLKDLLVLSQSSPVIKLACAGITYPSDVPADDEGLNMAMLETIKICDKPLVGFTQDGKISQKCIDIARIATEGKYRHFVMGIVNSLSPLAWDEKMLDAIITYAKANQPVIIACCSMAGFTSPTTLMGTVLQNNAEILAGVVLAQLVNPGAPVVYGNTSTISDMRSINICIGAPEYAIISSAAAQLARFYKIPYRSGGGLTDSKEPDMQSGIESATNLLFTASNGVHIALHSTGIMESFMSISFEKWIIDEEIIQRFRRIYDYTFRMPDAPVEMIGQAAAKGNFISHKDTLNNYRKEFYMTPVSDRANYDTWKNSGTNLLKTAYGIYKKRLERFEAPQLPAHVTGELDCYFRAKNN